jgi:Predicted permease.
MFFKQIKRNATRNWQDNLLFFATLIIAIIVFYILLSLGEQDVVRFLRTVESDAVAKLLILIDGIYLVSLFFVFFLVRFAYNYQINAREKEFGMYLMLGMKKSKLQIMLLAETVWNSMISLIIGLPIAIFCSEIVSLTCVKIIGLNIINHEITISTTAIGKTILGLSVIQLIAMIILGSSLNKKTPAELLNGNAEKKQRKQSVEYGIVYFALGTILLIIAYILGVKFFLRFNLLITLIILPLGIIGTFSLYRGCGVLIGNIVKRNKKNRTGLFTFTGRQIQENVATQYKSLAISSLLFLLALSCVSAGLGISLSNGSIWERTVDFSIESDVEKIVELEALLQQAENLKLIDNSYSLHLETLNTNIYNSDGIVEHYYENAHELSWTGIIEKINANPLNAEYQNLKETLNSAKTFPFIITQSDYNKLLTSNNKEKLKLKEQEVALYVGSEFSNDSLTEIIKEGTYLEINSEKKTIMPTIFSDNVVADRLITISLALILPDEYYQILNNEQTKSSSIYTNINFKQSAIEELGLIEVITSLENNIATKDFVYDYESFFSIIGRKLFYIVSASYLTIYLGILFLIIANLVLGIKYLMQQRQNRTKYQTLLLLGAEVSELCQSVNTQIRLFFLLVISVSSISAIFAIWSLFNSIITLPTLTINTIIITIISLLVFIMIEFIYIKAIQNISNREIFNLQNNSRS